MWFLPFAGVSIMETLQDSLVADKILEPTHGLGLRPIQQLLRVLS